tara:strand:- start:24 stop:263 length:240 start_codon:yes stop_codon:yes gene_type:complete
MQRGKKMTNKINLVINLSILALLIYLSVAVKQLQDKVFPDPNVMIPLIGQMENRTELEYNIRTFLNNVLTQAIEEQESQ